MLLLLLRSVIKGWGSYINAAYLSVSDIHDNIFPPKSPLHRTCFDQYFSCSGMTGRWGLYLMHRMQSSGWPYLKGQ